MSKIGRTIILSLFMLATFTIAFAQDFEPTDEWPYLYKDFQPGMIKMNVGGEAIKATEVNVALDGKVHYIDEHGQNIMAADMLRVLSVQIGEDTFLNTGGKMMKVLARNENGAVIREMSLNVDEMNKSDIGYGISSSTASTQKLSSLAGDSSSLVSLPLTTLMERRERGEKLPVRQRLYIRVGMNSIPANKKGINECPCIDKNAAKAFFKANKIKWNDPSSLLMVVDFVMSQNKR